MFPQYLLTKRVILNEDVLDVSENSICCKREAADAGEEVNVEFFFTTRLAFMFGSFDRSFLIYTFSVPRVTVSVRRYPQSEMRWTV